MPVRKFRSLQETEDALWRPPGDPKLWRAMASVWDFAARTCPRHFPPGVHKHRSIEDAQALRERWEAEDFRAFWERQRALGEGRSPRADSGKSA
ncbi:MAG TPA: hypothetical protein VJU18_05100 [Vicinamibacteria bacterium]|nr:hypothetical protein [Vicinamibacteria bacterium]